MSWPDWSGQIAAIVASGPSAKQADLGVLRGRCRVIAIKQTLDLCPWADVVYGCDAPWWRHRRGLPEFAGLKVCYAGNKLAEYPDIRRIDIDVATDDILLGAPDRVGSGGNSGFQALNLAVLWGARRVLLVGFDMTDRSGVHWYGRNTWPRANNPDADNFRRWLGAFERAKATLAGIGAEVINCSPVTAMKTFPRRSIADALEGWVAQA